MNTTAQQLYDNALELPDSERADLAAQLIESLDPDIDKDVDKAWDAEIQRRMEDLDSGAVVAIPWPEARRMIWGISNVPATDAA